MAKRKRTSTDLQNTTQKITDQATETPLKPEVNYERSIDCVKGICNNLVLCTFSFRTNIIISLCRYFLFLLWSLDHNSRGFENCWQSFTISFLFASVNPLTCPFYHSEEIGYENIYSYVHEYNSTENQNVERQKNHYKYTKFTNCSLIQSIKWMTMNSIW